MKAMDYYLDLFRGPAKPVPSRSESFLDYFNLIDSIIGHERHRRRHVELHRAASELAVDWAAHNNAYRTGRGRKKRLSTSSIAELLRWSRRQTVDPDEP